VIRKRASVFFSLRVGSRDLLFSSSLRWST